VAGGIGFTNAKSATDTFLQRLDIELTAQFFIPLGGLLCTLPKYLPR